uniref:Uncharacterized protein n=1 Tax=Pygocentrus nattereri TaxID=42514 RepID=A0AAR2JMV2_PYGNA
MGSALGLARRTLRTFPFHCMPCTSFMALSLSSFKRRLEIQHS